MVSGPKHPTEHQPMERTGKTEFPAK